MRKFLRDALCILLSLSMVLMCSGCGSGQKGGQSAYAIDDDTISAESLDLSGNVKPAVHEYNGLSDEDLLRRIEDEAYARAVADLASDGYLVEQVEAVYISQEYIDTMAFNSQSNKYFGYTIAELQDQFQGQRYIFTVDESGKTVVKAFEDYDDTFDQVIRNVAVGTGVILVCVTISVATAGAGAPAASMIFAVAAESGAFAALSGAAIGGASAAVATGIQTGDVEKTLKAAALGASEGYVMGAITGAISGGAGEAIALKNATASGLTMNQAATIQKESKYPLDVIKQMHSMEEYQVYKDAGLTTKMVDGKTALVQDIDLDFKTVLKDGTDVTNRQLMQNGYAPRYLDASGKVKSYQLHHIGQRKNATLAVLKEAEHQGQASVLNIADKASEINRSEFKLVREAFWKSFVEGM